MHVSRRSFFAAAGALAATPTRAASAQTSGARKQRKLVIGRQPFSGSSVAITRQMMTAHMLETEAARFGYDLAIDWRDFPNAGPIMELLKAGVDSMSFAFVGNTPVVTGIANGLPLQVVTTGEGTQPFFLLVRPNSDIHTMQDLKGKTVGTFIGLDPQNAFIQSLSAELKATPDALDIRFQNFPEFPVLARLPRGIDAAGMIPWSPAYTAIDRHQAVALFDTRGQTGPAYTGGAGHTLPGVANSPFRPEGYYQFRPFWIAHADLLRNDPDIVVAWMIAYQKGLDAIRAMGPEKVAEANQADWYQPPDIGRSIITADLLWNRGWVWLCEGDLVSVVAASPPLVAAHNIPQPVTWDAVKKHLEPIASMQQNAWQQCGSNPAQAAFDKPDPDLQELRGLPVWEMARWGRYADRA